MNPEDAKQYNDAQYKLERLSDGELKTEWLKNNEKENVNLIAEKLSFLAGRMIGKLFLLIRQMQLFNRFPTLVIFETLKNIHDMAVTELDEEYKLEPLINVELKMEWTKKDEKENVGLRAEKLLLLVCAFINDISRFLNYIERGDAELIVECEGLIEMHNIVADVLNELYYNDIKKGT